MPGLAVARKFKLGHYPAELIMSSFFCKKMLRADPDCVVEPLKNISAKFPFIPVIRSIFIAVLFVE